VFWTLAKGCFGHNKNKTFRRFPDIFFSKSVKKQFKGLPRTQDKSPIYSKCLAWAITKIGYQMSKEEKQNKTSRCVEFISNVLDFRQ
jgi:hypothetical protein